MDERTNKGGVVKDGRVIIHRESVTPEEKNLNSNINIGNLSDDSIKQAIK